MTLTGFLICGLATLVLAVMVLVSAFLDVIMALSGTHRGSSWSGTTYWVSFVFLFGVVVTFLYAVVGIWALVT